MLITAEAQPERQQTSARQSKQQMGIFSTNTSRSTIPLTDEPMNPKSCSVRFGYTSISAPFVQEMNQQELLSATRATGKCASNTAPTFTSLHLNWFITWGDGMHKWNRPFTHSSQLLTLRESCSSPLAWLDEYKLTYSPSPPSSFTLSLYGKKGGTQTEAWSSREGHSVCYACSRFEVRIWQRSAVQQGKLFSSSIIITTRWHWSASYARNSTYWQVHAVQHAPLGSFEINNKTADRLWAR